MRHMLAALVAGAGLLLAAPAARAGIDSSVDAPAADSAAVQAARAKVAAGEYAAAIVDLEAYTPRHPADIVAARLLGDLYFRIPNYKSAERVWKGILARNSDDRATHNRMGSLYAAEDRVAESIVEFERSLPERAGFEGLVAQHRRQGDLAAFSEQYRMQVDANPLDAPTVDIYANILRAQGKFVEAQPYFDRVVTIRPHECGPLVNAGNNEIDLGRLDRAITLLEACLAIDSKNYAALVDAGEAYIERSETARAGGYFERALAVRPAGSEALVDLGYIADDKGNWKGAVVDYIRAMIADPLRSEAYVDLGYDYNEHQLYQLAEATFLKGLSISPDDGTLHYLLAVTYNLQGKLVLAREQYQLAIASREPRVVRAAQAELDLLPRHT
jgi:tetratricopeptide (TPR) repeat protein